MDVLEFSKQYKRMCKCYYENKSLDDCCNGCPLSDAKWCTVGHGTDEDDKIVVSAVEEWVKTHPAKTRQSQLLEIFPNPEIYDGTGSINICPSCMDTNFECSGIMVCSDCKKKYWLKEIE